MKLQFGRRFRVFLLPAVLAGASLSGVLEIQAQQATSKARVGVQVRVDPIVRLEFPQGNEFELYIPSREEGRGRGGPFHPHHAPHLDIAVIPFEIQSNSGIIVEALPGEILEYFRGKAIGKAFPADSTNSATGAVLPYRLHLELPTKTRGRSVPGFSVLRGRNLTTSEISAADARGEVLSGTVYVIPTIKWGDISSRRFNDPGLYRGSVQITVSVSG